MHKIENFINGSFHKHNGDTLEVTSPITDSIIGYVPISTRNDLDKAVQLASIAQKQWSAQTLKERSQVVYKYRALLIQNRNDLSNLLHTENGKTMDEAYADVDKAIELCEFAASIPQIITGNIEEVSKGILCHEEYRPLGVVASITPFNFPVMVPHWTVPNAITLGNAMILKPSEATPICANFVANLWKEAGLPDGIYNVVHGTKEVVESICEHPDIKAVSFVGSTTVQK